MNRKIYLIIVLFGFCANVFSQQSAIYTNDLVSYNQALELYNNAQFLAAQNLFDKVGQNTKDENVKANCSYYVANCSVKLNQKGADHRLDNFVKNYPTSIKRNSAFLDVANYHFNNGKYANARKYYEKVEEGNLGREEKEKYYFNKGYAYFKVQRFNESKKYLNRVEDSPVYGAKAKYFLGFVAYEGDNYKEADRLFDEVKDLGEYNKNLSYFQSDMKFKSGDFQAAIDEGLKQLPNSKQAEKSELNKIIGESYFNLKEFDKAIPHLKEYKGRKGKWNNTDYYLLGYAYYKQGDYTSAISEFNKIVGGDNAAAQNAYYHLAEAYLKTGEKQQAINAFKNASEMDFEPKIKEDATYNYAKLSYEIGNSYEGAPTVLQSYLKKYPSSDKKDEIKELLISSYITSKNYKEAMRILDQNRSFAGNDVYQKVTFYRAIELYTANDYKEAINYLNKSLSQREDEVFTARAIYWRAEIHYILTDYKDALVGFKEFLGSSGAISTDEFSSIEYNLGYTYFKLKEYKQAINYFKTFAEKSNNDESKNVDAFLRLGDSNFISSKYWPAIEAYDMAIKKNGKDADYAYFQKAICYGFISKNDKKIKELEMFLKLYPNSAYIDDAMFSLGDVYVAEKRNRDGIATYSRLIKNTPSSSYVPKALLKQGLIYYNGNQGEQALTKFKKVAADFPGSEEAIQAVNTAKLIYVDLGRTSEYASWVKGLSFVDISDADIENVSFEAAEKQFIEKNSTAAIEGFRRYLSEYPKGIHATKSHFYLAQLYFDKGDKEIAIPHYESVLQSGRSEYTEQALARLSQLYLENSAYDKAIPLLERLESVADYPQNIIFAQSNLMKSHYQLLNYQKTIEYGDKVLKNSRIQNDVKSDAKIFIARAALQTEDLARARKAYAEVEKIASGELAAEALYYNAYFKHIELDYKSSNKMIQKLSKDYSGFRVFGAKGLVLMAKNFYGLKDAYQATYILDSVIKNFTDLPKVVSNAKKELKKIKAQESKTNSSIIAE